jgi:hypothetical protein
MSSIRYEIANDGTTRTYRELEELAREAAIYLEKLNSNSEITLRDPQTGTVTQHRRAGDTEQRVRYCSAALRPT